MSALSVERVQTPRMICERLRSEHTAEVSRLLLDPRVARTLWPQAQVPTERDLMRSMHARLDHWERFGFGLWMLRDRDTGEMVGRGGLQHTIVANLYEVEAGWAIVPERWGQGLATELAWACVQTAFQQLELRQIVAFALPENIASRRVMEKAGFVYDSDVIHAGLPHVLYRRTPEADRGTIPDIAQEA